jgi:hypothetical protein
MKNKLMTTALVTSMLSIGVTSAVAQTTITGNIDMSYFGTSAKGSAATGTVKGISNTRGFGKEAQVNFANKGKMSNGMDYAAGFSIELDGPDTSGTAMFAENTYIDLISGNTTITLGADHIQNPDRNVTNLVGFGYLGLDGLNNKISSYPKAINSPYSSFGAGIVQTIPGLGKVSALYVPDRVDASAQNDVLNGVQSSRGDQGESMYELGFKGDLGVKGLDVGVFYNKGDKNEVAVATINDRKGVKFDASYNFGQFTVAADYSKMEGVEASTGTTSAMDAGNDEVKGKSIGVAYAVNKELSIGYAYGKTSTNQTGGTFPDEKVNLVAIGYNLGPVVAQLQYKTVDNHANTANLDGEQIAVKLGTKF